MTPILFNTYRSVQGFNKRVRFLILHYTALDFAGSIKALTGSGQVSAHYLAPDPCDPSYQQAGFKQMNLFNLVDENDRAWHAGASAWDGRSNLNDSSIGVEIVNLAREEKSGMVFPPYHPQQVEAVTELARNILARYPDISPVNVLGHSDIAVGRKSDPGPMFPWRSCTRPGWARGRRWRRSVNTRSGSSSRACPAEIRCWRRSSITATRWRRRAAMPVSPPWCAPSRCISALAITAGRWTWRPLPSCSPCWSVIGLSVWP